MESIVGHISKAKDFFSKEDMLFAIPVAGDLYMMAITIFNNRHTFREILPANIQPMFAAASQISPNTVGFSDESALRACHYTLAKVAGYVIFSFFSLVPVLGSFISGFVITSNLLFVGVMILNTAIIAKNIENRKGSQVLS